MSDFEERARKAADKYYRLVIGKLREGTPSGVEIFCAGFKEGAADRERELLAPGPCKVHPKACWVETPILNDDGQRISECWECAACRRERELREPGPCGVKGHTMADLELDEAKELVITPQGAVADEYCAACRREQAKDAEIAKLRESLRDLYGMLEPLGMGTPNRMTEVVYNKMQRVKALLNGETPPRPSETSRELALRKALEAAPSPYHDMDVDAEYAAWHRTVRAAALGGGGK